MSFTVIIFLKIEINKATHTEDLKTNIQKVALIITLTSYVLWSGERTAEFTALFCLAKRLTMVLLVLSCS